MKKLVIFGTGNISEVLFHFFMNRSDYEIAAFTVDAAYVSGDTAFNLPLVPFENIENEYSPDEYHMFVALGYQELNSLRERKLAEAKGKGYKIASFIHDQAGLPSDTKVGENCFIMHNVHIHPLVEIGDNVFIWSGTIICHHTRIQNHCWFTSGTNIAGNVTIGKNCFFGINSTVGHGVNIGDKCFFGSNSLVVRDVESESVFIEPETKLFRLNSTQFLQMSNFDKT